MAALRDQWDARIKADVGIACYERVVGKAWVFLSILYDQKVRLEDGMGAEGHVTRRFSVGEAQRGFEPLAFSVDEGDAGNGRSTDEGGQAHDVIVGIFGFRIEYVIIMQGCEPGIFLVGQGSSNNRNLCDLPSFSIGVGLMALCD